MRHSVRIISDPRLLLALVAALLAAAPLAVAGPLGRNSSALRQAGAIARFAAQSPDISPGGTIAPAHVYDRSGCHGGNVSPALSWTRPPAGTRSFAVLMFDPDAPAGGWWHWAVFDIPAGVTSLRAGAGDPDGHLLPPGAIQAHNDFGSAGYAGPCPPPGAPHHYRLMIYALRSAKLGLDASARPAEVAAKVGANAVAQAEIVGVYGR